MPKLKQLYRCTQAALRASRFMVAHAIEAHRQSRPRRVKLGSLIFGRSYKVNVYQDYVDLSHQYSEWDGRVNRGLFSHFVDDLERMLAREQDDATLRDPGIDQITMSVRVLEDDRFKLELTAVATCYTQKITDREIANLISHYRLLSQRGVESGDV